MFNYLNKQYIFKQSSGAIWNFFFDEKLGLCYSNLTKRDTWTDPVSLQKNLMPFFYADIDYDDCFHVLFVDTEGNIYYSKIDKNINTIPVLNSKISSTYNKHLFLLPLKNNIQLFYILHHNNSFILAHQPVCDGKTGSPKVVDYVLDNARPFSVICDKCENIYAFYQASEGAHIQIGYKKCTSKLKQWSEFIPISRYEGDCEFPSIVNDSKNIMHICYQRRLNRQFELVYQQKISEKNIWTSEIVLHNSMYPFDNSFMISVHNTLTVYWIRDNVIYFTSSIDDGNTWSKPIRYNFPIARQLLCMSYKTNSPYESERIIAETIPGSFTNGIKFAFFEDSPNTANNLTADELKNLLIDGLKLLKGNVEELNESNSKVSDSISKLNALQQYYEKELVKYSVRLGMLENELNQLKINSIYCEKVSTTLDQLDLENQLLKIKEMPDFTEWNGEIVSDILNSSRFKNIEREIEELKNALEALKNSESSVDNTPL